MADTRRELILARMKTNLDAITNAIAAELPIALLIGYTKYL